MNRSTLNVSLAAGLFLFGGISVIAAEQSYSPYVNKNYPEQVYWGDTHLHTSISVDAYYFGNRISADDAYRFAKGETVTGQNGMQVRLHRPLDFLVVADHSDSMGTFQGFIAKNLSLLQAESVKPLYERYLAIREKGLVPGRATREGRSLGLNIYGVEQDEIEPFSRSVWNDVAGRADRFNDPGRFSAFIGYEWGAGRVRAGEYATIHRVVVVKDDAEKATQVLPFVTWKSNNPEDLWAYMENYQRLTGGEMLAIPHNGNVSNGDMFMELDSNGQPFTAAYAKARSRWEPLYEITQIKGDGEAHPMLSPTDEFADYETWHSWDVTQLPEGRTWNDAEIERKKREYARSAFKLGLEQQTKLGVNPFKFGVIGSTDAHTSLSAVGEDNFWGKKSDVEPRPDRMTDPSTPAYPESLSKAWHFSSSGYAAVWARENTRDALFAAMKRKETYASTGPRMTVRFFGGWNYNKDDAFKPDLAQIGYMKGVPMGGDLASGPKGEAPSFLIHAAKDPDGANLDRVQVIKGWRNEEGELHEKVYNVALSDGRVNNRNGSAPAVGNTVNVKNATYTNTIGDPELAVVWKDPDFNPQELAFYYVRVLEIPTPRWTAYDANFFKIKNIPKEIPMITQERAYTSPIWYTPFL